MKAIAFKTAQSKLSKIIDSVILTNKPVKIWVYTKIWGGVVFKRYQLKLIS